MITPRRLGALVILTLGIAMPVAAAGPANASGSIGACYPTISGPTVGGWCDGTGPDWTYRAIVYCGDGATRYGITRWAGDRRGSTYSCFAGSPVYRSGLAVYYKGVYQYTVTP